MPPLNYNEWIVQQALVMVTWECIEWEWHKSFPVNGKTYEITNLVKNVKNTQNWTFDVQTIPDNMNLKYQHLNPFGTCWPQELRVEHTVVH